MTEQISEKTVSRIRQDGGKEQLIVNGQVVVPNAYMTYFPEKNAYGDFASAGIGLYSLSVFFSGQSINERTAIPPFCPGIFDGEVPDYSGFDRDVSRILREDPDAMILLRVNTSLPRKWEEDHPDELCFTGPDEHPERRRACFSSDVWAAQTERLLTLFVAHVENAAFCRHIVGYQLAGGNTEEWFSFDYKGSLGKRSQEKYAAYLKKTGADDTDERLYRFLSETVADRIDQFAALVKRLTQRRLIVGAFYGYTGECCDREHVHHALARLLKSEQVDFLCSPVSYYRNREPGHYHAYMVPLDSLKLHGKMFFSENDIRTHLSMPPFDLPAYRRDIWKGFDKESTIAVLKMHFARLFIHGHGGWWFDMWGGWYKDPDFMALFARCEEILRESREETVSPVYETGVFIDEDAYAGLGRDRLADRYVLKAVKQVIGLAGVPYGKFLSSDFDAAMQAHPCKAVLSVVPHPTPASLHIRDVCTRRGIPLWEITKEDAARRPEEFRAFFRAAGMHLYIEKDGVIYASDRYLFLHAAQDGEYRLEIGGRRLWELFEKKEYGCVFLMKKGESRLFRFV